MVKTAYIDRDDDGAISLSREKTNIEIIGVAKVEKCKKPTAEEISKFTSDREMVKVGSTVYVNGLEWCIVKSFVLNGGNHE